MFEGFRAAVLTGSGTASDWAQSMIRFSAMFARVLGLMVQGCQQREKEAPKPLEGFEVVTPEGVVTAEPAEVEPMRQTVSRVSSDDIARFGEWAKEAPDLLETYGDGGSTNELKKYDAAFAGWWKATNREHSDREVVNLIGAWMGQRMAEDFSMEWVEVIDGFGRDFAVRRKEGNHATMTFPFSIVRKRVESGELDFVHANYHIARHLMDEAEQKNATDAKPDAPAR